MPIRILGAIKWWSPEPASTHCMETNVAAGAIHSPKGRSMSINVEVLGGTVTVSHYAEEIAEKSQTWILLQKKNDLSRIYEEEAIYN